MGRKIQHMLFFSKTSAQVRAMSQMPVDLGRNSLSFGPMKTHAGNTMKANVFRGGLKFENTPLPQLQQSTDVIVQLEKMTICGTDLHILQGGVETFNPGNILGHEGIGTIIEKGQGVRSFLEGDRVLIPCITKCMKCDQCRRMMYGHCRFGGWTFGNSINGMQAEYARVPLADTSLYSIPNTTEYENQYLMCADILPTSYEVGLLAGKMTSDKTITVVGCGPVGLATILNVVAAYNPKVIIACDLEESRLEIAREFGATHTVLSSNHKDGVQQIMQLTDGVGVDLAVECVGHPPGWYTCQDIVSCGGRIALLGVHGLPVELNLQSMWYRNFEFSAGLVHGHTIVELMKRIETKQLRADKLITHTLPLSQITHAYELFRSRKQDENAVLKILLENDISPRL